MAGSITVSSITLDSDNNFSIKSNTGATLLSANASGIVSGVQNTAITGTITNAQLAGSITGDKIGLNAISSNNIVSVSNTAISGKITGTQLANATGVIAQVGSAILSNEITYTGNYSGFVDKGQVDSSNFYVTLTPKSASSKFLIFYQLYYNKTTYPSALQFRLVLNDALVNDVTGTDNLNGLYSGHRIQIVSDSYWTHTAATVYQCQNANAHTFKVNVRIYDESSNYTAKMFPTGTKMTVLEIA